MASGREGEPSLFDTVARLSHAEHFSYLEAPYQIATVILSPLRYLYPQSLSISVWDSVVFGDIHDKVRFPDILRMLREFNILVAGGGYRDEDFRIRLERQFRGIDHSTWTRVHEIAANWYDTAQQANSSDWLKQAHVAERDYHLGVIRGFPMR